jgi:hypothetical protein
MKDFLDLGARRSRMIRAFAANAGYWTCPSVETPFPFGFGKLPFSAQNVQNFLTSQLHVLLGENDNDENHQHLNRSARAMLQGRHRLERGQVFYQSGVEAASRLGVKLGWTLELVHGAGHSNKAMFKCVLRALDAYSQHSLPHGAHSSRAWIAWQDQIPPCEAGNPHGHERRGEGSDLAAASSGHKHHFKHTTSSSSHKNSSKDPHGSTRKALCSLGGSNCDAVPTKRQVWLV